MFIHYYIYIVISQTWIIIVLQQHLSLMDSFEYILIILTLFTIRSIANVIEYVSKIQRKHIVRRKRTAKLKRLARRKRKIKAKKESIKLNKIVCLQLCRIFLLPTFLWQYCWCCSIFFDGWILIVINCTIIQQISRKRMCAVK